LVDDVSMNGCASTPPVGFPFGFDASAEGWLMGGAPGRVATALAYAAGQGFSGGALQLTISHQMSGDFGQATFAFP
jgi:hypothetical protein